MTDDLVMRLRDCANGSTWLFKTQQGDFGICDEAADRIEQLERELSISRMAQVVMDNGAEELTAERDKYEAAWMTAEGKLADAEADNARLRGACEGVCGGDAAFYITTLLVDFTRAVWNMMDNSETTTNDSGEDVTTVWQQNFDEVSALLDRLEGLPSGSTEQLSAAGLVQAHLTALPALNTGTDLFVEMVASMDSDFEHSVALLSDPVAVYLNMLRGTIAKPTVEQIIHIYGADALCRGLSPVIVREVEEDYERKVAQMKQDFPNGI